MAKMLTKQRRKVIGKYWGYALIPITLWAWLILQVGAAPIAIMSGLIVAFTLFRADVPCGAETREKDPDTGEFLLCRHNAHGILGGCRQFQAHKWGNAKLMLSRSTWGRLLRSLMRRVGGQAATVSALAGSLSAVVAVGALLVNMIK